MAPHRVAAEHRNEAATKDLAEQAAARPPKAMDAGRLRGGGCGVSKPAAKVAVKDVRVRESGTGDPDAARTKDSTGAGAKPEVPPPESSAAAEPVAAAAAVPAAEPAGAAAAEPAALGGMGQGQAGNRVLPPAMEAGSVCLWLIDANALRTTSECAFGSFDEYLGKHFFARQHVSLHQRDATTRVLAVSHSWEGAHAPDQAGAQWQAVKAHVHTHPEITHVWYDFSCVPTPAHRTADDERALQQLHVLFLSASVLVLLDLKYLSKWRTTVEAWMSLMTASPSGLAPASDSERRCTITCIHNAHPQIGPSKLLSLATKSAKDLHDMISAPDVSKDFGDIQTFSHVQQNLLRIDEDVRMLFCAIR